MRFAVLTGMTQSAVVVLLAFAAFAQEAALQSRISQIEIGKSTLEDVVRLLGEPERYGWGSETFTRANLPARYMAQLPNGIRVVVRDGRVREMHIRNPEYRVAGRIQVGSTVAELVKAVPPAEVVKGSAPEGERPKPGILYEGSENKPGFYVRPELGVGFGMVDGKVASIIKLERPQESTQGRPFGDPCMAGLPRKGGALKEFPRFDASAAMPRSPGVCAMDLSQLDLRGRAADLLKASFDNKTVWPLRDRLPEGFDPQRILELGRNPGLGVRGLHGRGITGKGVSIALVDNPLLAGHREYAERLRFHEYSNARPEEPPHFHGSFVVSMAAGKTVGVAPEADIYYVSSWAFDGEGNTSFLPRAQAFQKLMDVNRTLPAARKIRVISMSFGWRSEGRGGAEMDAAAKRARDEGILVIAPNITQIHGFRFHGLGREPLADPDRFESYLPGEWWARQFYAGPAGRELLLAPMDSRTGAGPGGNDEYMFSRIGGWSWTMPYLAGVYALAAQVDPAITPERFWRTALATGRTIQIGRGGQSFALGPIADPAALIAALEKR